MIVDAERHRRTPGTPVTWCKVIESKKSANIGDAGAARNWKRISTIEIATRIKAASRKRLWTVLMQNGWFWVLKSWKHYQIGARNLSKINKNLENITKTASKINEKSRLRRGCVFVAALGRQKVRSPTVLGSHLATIFDQKSKKGIQKGMQN